MWLLVYFPKKIKLLCPHSIHISQELAPLVSGESAHFSVVLDGPVCLVGNFLGPVLGAQCVGSWVSQMLMAL